MPKSTCETEDQWLDRLIPVRSHPLIRKKEPMDRVVITIPIVGPAHMQVCAVKDATDEEILAKCAENVAGTQHGWTTVLRQDGNTWGSIPCAVHPNRVHVYVMCG